MIIVNCDDGVFGICQVIFLRTSTSTSAPNETFNSPKNRKKKKKIQKLRNMNVDYHFSYSHVPHSKMNESERAGI